MNFIIEIMKSKNQWYWRLKSRNGKILAHSEKYTRKHGAYKTALKVYEGLRYGGIFGGCKFKERVNP